MEARVPDQVLLIDDDQRLASMLTSWLGSRGITLTARHTASTGTSALRVGRYDLLLLDLMLPDADGLDVCRAVRASHPHLPILMLTARGDPTDRVIGLEVGADDYLPKPFDPRELLARVRAILRRVRRGPSVGTVLRFGALELDHGALEVRVHGTPKPLTARQFQVLWALASRSGRVLDRAQLNAAIGEGGGDPLDRTIDVHISRIRAAIESDPRRPRYLKTVRGMGYLFVDAAD
jgi:two-component system phosphate regulon response regulator OmpR